MSEQANAKDAARSPTIQTCLRFAINGFGWLGGVFILYGIVSAATKEPWPPLERLADLVSSALAIIGTMVTAISVYFFDPHPNPPERMSIYIVAPIAILGCLVALVFLFWKGAPTVIVNGISIIGLAGALLRIQPNPYLMGRQ